MTWLKDTRADGSNYEYGTPTEVWRPLAATVDGFDLDPCSGAEPEPIAPNRYTVDDDGLSQPWFGHVFVNPPWATNGNGSAKHEWLRKARTEARSVDVDSVTVLVPSDTSTHWFHDHVVDAPIICFTGPGRMTFIGEGRKPSIGVVIAVWGDVPEEYVDVLESFGAVFSGRQYREKEPQSTFRLVADVGGESDV